MASNCASPSMMLRPERNLSGRQEWTGPIFIHCFRAGTILPPNAVGAGTEQYGRYFVFQSLCTTADRMSGPRAREEPSLGKADRGPVQLTAGPMDFLAPVPSKDGKKLLVVGRPRRAELAGYDLKMQQFVPFMSGMSAESLTYSNDGQWVTYTSIPEGNLFRSRIDGSRTLLFNNRPGQS